MHHPLKGGKMTGELASGNGRCPLCSGRLVSGLATIPFLLAGVVVVMKNVPARVCEECDEPFLDGQVTDTVVEMLSDLRSLHAEVSVVSYSKPILEPTSNS
jgi:YgiT-type zinc finger domain-containing protein